MWQVLSLWWEMSMKLYTVWRNSDCIGLPGDQAVKSTNHLLRLLSVQNPTLPCRLVDLERPAHLKCLWLRILHWSCWESWSYNFKIAFVEKFWRDWALTWAENRLNDLWRLTLAKSLAIVDRKIKECKLGANGMIIWLLRGGEGGGVGYGGFEKKNCAYWFRGKRFLHGNT